MEKMSKVPDTCRNQYHLRSPDVSPGRRQGGGTRRPCLYVFYKQLISLFYYENRPISLIGCVAPASHASLHI